MPSLVKIVFRYEGTGRSLSLKLIHQLRVQSSTFGGHAVKVNKGDQKSSTAGCKFTLIKLLFAFLDVDE